MTNKYLEKIAMDADRVSQLTATGTGALYGAAGGAATAYLYGKPFMNRQAKKVSPDLAVKAYGKDRAAYFREHASGFKGLADGKVREAAKHPQGSAIRNHLMQQAQMFENKAIKAHNLPVNMGRARIARIGTGALATAGGLAGAGALGSLAYFANKPSKTSKQK